MMKKIIIFVLIFIFLIGCGNETDYQAIVNAIDFKVIGEVTEDINLETNLTIEGKDVQIKWRSSNTGVISNEGKVKRNQDDVIVTLFADITIDEYKETKEFVVKVIKEDANSQTIKLEQIRLSYESDVFIGDEFLVDVAFVPENATNKEIEWLSSDETIIKYENNTFIAISEGVATLTALADDYISSSITINVKNKTILVSKIEYEFSEKMYVGDSREVIFHVEPEYATNKRVEIKSSDPSIIMVEDRNLYAINEGKVTITLTSLDEGRCSVSFDVIVNNRNILIVSIESNDLQMNVNDRVKLDYTINPNNATNKNVSIVSSNEDVVIIEDGNIVSKNAGKSIITIATLDGSGVRCSIEVTVVNNEEAVMQNIKDTLMIEDEIKINTSFPSKVSIGDTEYDLFFTPSLDDGMLVIPEEEGFVQEISFLYKEEKISILLNVISYKEQIERFLETISIPQSANQDLNLVTRYSNIELQWTSNNKKVLDNDGKISYVEEAVTVELSLMAFIEYGDDTYFYDHIYIINVLPFEEERRIDLAYEKIKMPSETDNNLALAMSYPYGVSAKWESSNDEVISPQGLVNPCFEDTVVKLSLELECNGVKQSYTFDVLVKKIDLTGCDEYVGLSNIIDRAADYDYSKLNNLEYKDGKIVLKEGALSGYYESKVFKVKEFDNVVGSYSCTSSLKGTGELEISIRVNGKWSRYFSYGEYGQGRSNIYYDSSDDVAYLETDTIFINNNKKGDAVKYKFTMRRASLQDESPKLSLVAIALKIPNYVINHDVSTYPKALTIEVPKLYQHDVPSIGSVICSATTTTMLLKWKGFDFSNKGYNYEHQYIANLVADRGHNNPTYGNWSYNMITAGSFGVDAYVLRLYTWDEVKYYLNTNGPIGVNVRGTFGIYTTGGHLLVVKGYNESNEGTTVICNDPNVKGVHYEVSLDTFMRCWVNIAYVIEK